MRVEISALHREVGKTMIYVTHDQVEAMTLADKMVVLRAGRVEQVGHPLALYANPCNAFVAGFVGSPAMNMLEAELEADPKADPKAKPGAVDGSGIARLADGTRIPCVLAQAGAAGPCTIGVRPEHWQRSADGAEGAVRAVVNAVERLGATAYVHAAAGKATLCIEDRSGAPPRPGDCIAVAPLQGMTYVFDRDGRTISAPKAAPVAA
jgi:ABC-type sugar transport system ATPase subunit